MVKRTTLLAGIFSAGALLSALPLGALDFDFTVIGGGESTPDELSLFRRGKGYTVAVKQSVPGKDYQVFFDTDNSPATGMPAGKTGADWRLLKNGTLEKFLNGKWIPAGKAQKTLSSAGVNSYYINDKQWNLNEKQTIAVVCRENGSSLFLPDVTNGPLLVNGYMRDQYSWNNPRNTIIQQISDRKVTFTDPCGDVATPLSDDLISGSAEVRNDSLYLTCRAADPFKNPLRIFIDSIPNSGYGPGEADFMIERGKLFRYTGTPEKRWSWEKNLWHNVQMKFSADKREVSCSIPLSEIRNDLPGRIRVTFSSACKGSLGDSMPTFGKVIPVLRPGNLAAQKDTKLSVSSTYPKYKTFPLIDGQAARQAYYSFAAWASANVKEDHFVDFQFTKSEQPRIVTIWWEMEPQEILIQTKNDQEWQTVVDYQVPEKEECSYIRLPKGFKSTAIRIKMPAGKGNKRRSQLLWIREIEIY